ncbi:MAG: hypothetical protein WCO45_08805 [Pseudanabaena sp. ELA607]
MKVTLKLELSSLKSSETKYTTAWLFFLNHFLFFCLQLSSTLLYFKNFDPDSSSRACGNCGKLLKIFTQQYFQGFLPVENPVEN